jgi:hypothetical protein
VGSSTEMTLEPDRARLNCEMNPEPNTFRISVGDLTDDFLDRVTSWRPFGRFSRSPGGYP